MQSDPSRLLEIAGIQIPLIGFYDAPDPAAFAPVIEPSGASHVCAFAYFKRWLRGETLLLTAEKHGCGGAGRSLCNVPPADVLAFTVTRSMFSRLCELDEQSFLYKPFWQKLRKSRASS